MSDEELLESNNASNLQQPEKDIIAFHELMKKLKEKIQHKDTTRVQKIHILTLVPAEWGILRTAQYFNISTYLIRRAQTVTETHGILI